MLHQQMYVGNTADADRFFRRESCFIAAPNSQLRGRLRSGYKKLTVYRGVHQVALYILLTSNWELRFSLRRLYSDRTFALTSIKGSVQPDGPPCKNLERRRAAGGKK